MSYHVDKALAIRLTEKQIEVYENMLSKIPAIEETISKFDGKQATKRIATALESIGRGIHFHKNQYSTNWELTITEYDNRSVNGAPDSYGYCCTNYISDNTMYLADSYGENAFVDENGKLNAGKLIEQIERKREEYAKEVEELKEQLSRIDQIIALRDTIERMKHDFNDNINCLIRDYFGLEV